MFYENKGSVMHISPISFGKKFKVGECQIKDIRQNKVAKATIYQFDCKDYSDIEEISRLDDDWQFKNVILSKMIGIYNSLSYKQNHCSFYTMENDEGRTIGLLQTKDYKPELDLDYIESKGEGRYKYIGQSMLSFLCKFALENDFKNIYVPIPVLEAWDFYTKVCKFRKAPQDCAVTLSRFGMKRLQKSVEKKINAF